jgi:ABC-2 type transport system permease protein
VSHVWRIAVREYSAYVHTVGFWLSILLLPVGFSTLAVAPALMQRSTPPPALAVVDLTGRRLAPEIARAIRVQTIGGAPPARLVAAPGAPFADASDASRRLRPLLAGPRPLPDGTLLDVVAILRPVGGTVAVDVWSRQVADRQVAGLVGDAVDRALRRQALARAGVDPAMVAAIDHVSASVTDFSPKAAEGRVALRDRLPGLVGLGMGFLLWMSVLTGAGMLLGSVIEEKSSRILEILLSSVSVADIMAGKILGVAGVTGTVLALWITIAGVVLGVRFPSVGADLVDVLLAKGLLAYFAVYFIGGYLMFATLYVTIGAFCESPREARALLGPMMIVISIPLMFMGQALSRPDAPMLTVLAFVPPFTPFMMVARVAAGPPLWQVVATVVLMAATTGLELWVAIPAFRAGALTSGRFELRTFLAGLARRLD